LAERNDESGGWKQKPRLNVPREIDASQLRRVEMISRKRSIFALGLKIDREGRVFVAPFVQAER